MGPGMSPMLATILLARFGMSEKKQIANGKKGDDLVYWSLLLPSTTGQRE